MTSIALAGHPRGVQTTMKTPREGAAMHYRAAAVPAKEDRVASDSRVVYQAVLCLCSYSATCGVIAVVLGDLAAKYSGAVLPASLARFGTVGALIVAGGLNAERVVRRVEYRLGALPAGQQR
jgi:hypothetical protein